MLAIVDAQHYRPARWRMADHELGYRRFFDVDSLVALRTGDPLVFERSHELVRRLADGGLIDGVRVDHIDGLRDPGAYCHALRTLVPNTWIGLEKILAHRERLPTSWPVDGTTGYDAAAILTPFLIDPRHEGELDALYRARSGDELTFAEHSRIAREEAADSLLGSDVARLTNLLHRLLVDDPRHRDTSVEEARRAIVAVVSSLTRYRTYVRVQDDGSPEVTASDRHIIRLAVTTAAANHPDVDAALLEFIEETLTLDTTGTGAVEFTMRFQQLSGPVMAKGVEDTALYRSVRLLAHNDVGHEPSIYSVPPETVHWWAEMQARRSPRSMLTTSTHDTKRSEDVRARLAVLAEDPAGWADTVRHLDTELADVLPGAPGVEWFVYQTAFGAWPIDDDRLWPVVLKSMREAKQQTSWLAPDDEFEAAVQRFVTALTTRAAARAVLDEHVRRVGLAGRANSLALLVLRATLPGFPDTYQGMELWGDSLVDPDNRRPVDFELRRAVLAGVARGDHAGLVGRGRPRRREDGGAAGRAGAPAAAPDELHDVRVPGARARGTRTAGRDRLPAGHRRGRRGAAVPTDGSEPAPGDDTAPAARFVAERDDRRGARFRSRLRRRADAAASRIGAGAGAMIPRVWAPRAARVDLVTEDGRRPLRADPDGWFVGDEPLPAGSRYSYSLDGGPPRADPRSASQPDGVTGPSAVVDHGAFRWTDQRWHGSPLAGAVIYELHIGTFSAAGTFAGAIEHLDHLVDLGVTLVEVMPIGEFPGGRGWGYDGVLPFAVHHAYGGPDGFKAFVDAAHERGLGVLLDVVYNHFGPEANHLDEFAPYTHDVAGTPWGQAVNLDGEGSDEVRRFIVDNLRHWVQHFHVDGLRLDATHALVDSRAQHILAELAGAALAAGAAAGRTVLLVAEDDRNDPRLTAPLEAGGFGLAGRWSDDLHHGLHAVLTGERADYFVDYASVDAVARALDHVHHLDGRWSHSRQRGHGAPVGDTPRHRFVVAAQNHDQIGNRAGGERLVHLVGTGAAKLAAGVVLLGPYTPLLFQGQEWGASSPFRFFADFQDATLRDGGDRGPQPGVRRAGRPSGRAGRSLRPRDVRTVPPALGRTRRRASRGDARLVSAAPRPSPAGAGALGPPAASHPGRARRRPRRDAPRLPHRSRQLRRSHSPLAAGRVAEPEIILVSDDATILDDSQIVLAPRSLAVVRPPVVGSGHAAR